MRAATPRQVEPVGVDPAGEFEAVDCVDFDPFALAPQTDDPVARHRVAAGRERVADIGSQSPDRDHPLAPGPVLVILEFRGAAGHQRFHHFAVGQLGRADGEHQVFGFFHA